MIFNWLNIRRLRRDAAKKLYQTTLVQSRDPVFYADFGVCDTMDGRFDVLAFHAALVMNRLRNLGSDGAKLAQAYFDVLFVEVDFALRESGVGDLGVPKHMAKMMKAFNGRVHAYSGALDQSAMEQAISRNIFRTEQASAAVAIAAYAFDVKAVLEKYDMEDFKGGRVAFPALRVNESAGKALHG